MDGCPFSSLYSLISPLKKLNYPYSINYNTRSRRGNFVHLFVEATDGYAAFTTPLRLDTSFAMSSRALRPDLDRAKSAPSFETQTGQTCLPQF